MSQLVNMQVITMSSHQLVNMVNANREEGEAEVSHGDFLKKVPKVLGECAGNFSCTYEVPGPNGGFRLAPRYLLPKREACLMAMSYSYKLQAMVYDRMTELELLSVPALPKTFSDALRLAADQQEQIEQQAQQLAIAAPKVEFVDKYVEASGLKGFRQVAKLLGIKENLFRAFLVEHKIQYQIGGDWVPYANHIDAGRFEVKTGTAAHNDHAFTSARFTSKGIEWVSRLLRDSKREPEKALGIGGQA